MKYSFILLLALSPLTTHSGPIALSTSFASNFAASVLNVGLPENLKQICRNIENESKKKFGEKSMDYCDSQITTHMKNRGDLLNTCYLLLTENENVYETCVKEFKIHNNILVNENSQTEKDLIGNPEYSILDKEAVRGIYSKTMHTCQPSNFGSCTDASAQFLFGIEQIINEFPEAQPDAIYTYAQPIYDETTCHCLEDKMKANFSDQGKSEQDLMGQIEQQKNKISKILERTLARKFVNDLSIGLEDVNYYLTNNFRALGKDYRGASNLQCNNPKIFRDAMEDSCARNNIDTKTRDENLNSIMGNDINGPQSHSFEEKIRALSDEVLNKSAKGKESRAAYDIARLGIVNKSPQLHFMNLLMTELIQNPELSDTFANIIDPVETPGAVLNKLLLRLDTSLLSSSINSILSRSRRVKLTKDQKDFYNNLELLSNSVDSSGVIKLVTDSAEFSVMQYPGYRALLSDFTLFNKIKAKGINGSVIDTLESNPDLLAAYYGENCNKLVNQVAEAVCAPKGNLVSKVSPEELNKLLTSSQLEINIELKDALLCQTNKTKDGPKITNLDFANNRILLSEYTQKQLNPKGTNKTGYENYLASLKKGGQVQGYFSSAANLGAEIRTTSGIEKLLVQQTSSAKKSSEVNTYTSALVESAKTVKAVKAETFENNFQPMSNYAAPPSLPSAKPLVNETQNTDSKLDSKSLLREFLADENNKDEIEKHLSNTSDEDLQRLMELKDMIAKDQSRLNDLLRQNDKAKLQDMESNLKKMEDEMKGTSKRVMAERNFSDSTFQNGFNGPASQQHNNLDHSSRDSSRANDSSSSGGARTSSSRSNSGALSEGARSVASIPEVARSIVRDTNDGAIIIESSIVRIPGKALAREELSKEIISYVNTSQLNLADLMKMKESGLVLKVKSLQNGQEINEEIKVNFSELTTEAKLLLENKIAGIEKEQQYDRLKRDYSFETLRLILATKAQSGL